MLISLESSEFQLILRLLPMHSYVIEVDFAREQNHLTRLVLTLWPIFTQVLAR